MAKTKSGKCGCGTRIVSNIVQNMQRNDTCQDICVNPIYDSPKLLSIMAPLIYDEIGINLCATLELGTDLAADYPTAVSASVQVLDVSYDYGTGNVLIDAIIGRPNCYVVTLSNLTVQFAVSLYDANCRLLGVIYPTALYLPASTTADTYDPDTNPTSVELEIFAPYGISYDQTAGAPTPAINYVGFRMDNNYVRQGLNLHVMGKVLNLETEDSTATIGLTLTLQSLYFAGYRVESAGKIATPKGSIIVPDNSNCLNFVAGDLLNLAIKPLELGAPLCEEQYKQSCSTGGSCGTMDDTVILPGIIPEPT